MQPGALVESASEEPAPMEQTLPLPAPDLSAAWEPSPPVEPEPSAPTDFSPLEATVPIPWAGDTATLQAAGPPPGTLEPPLLPDATVTEPAPAAAAVLPSRKSKLIPLVFGAVVLIMVGEGIWAYWKFHQRRGAAAPVVVQTPPVAAPAVVVPEPSSPPPPATPAEQTPEAVKPAPAIVKKSVRKAKPIAAPPAEPAAPIAAPVRPAVTPHSPTPSPEEIARTEAAKTASTPRVVQVVCSFEFKEATFTIFGGGQNLFEQTLKAKRKKAGFLGIKGSYEGNFTQPLNVPAGAQELSVRVVAKDGAMDMSKVIKMPPPGGFVPTLNVEVDGEQLSVSWKTTATVE
jgi:hypothetical protein